MFPATDFQLGIWNAYVLLLLYFVLTYIPSFFRRTGQKKFNQFNPGIGVEDPYGTVLYYLLFIIFLLSIVISFFLPLKFFTWYFILGIILYIIGTVIVLMVMYSWMKTPSSDLIDSGIYLYSRHPMYISMFFTHIGIGIITASWIFLLLIFVYIILTIFYIDFEEQACIKKYGKLYREYMEKTPRWLGKKI